MRLQPATWALFALVSAIASHATSKEGEGEFLSRPTDELRAMDVRELAAGLVAATQTPRLHAQNYDDFSFSRERTLRIYEILYDTTFRAYSTNAEKAQRMEAVVEAIAEELRSCGKLEDRFVYFLFALVGAEEFVEVISLASLGFVTCNFEYLVAAAAAAGKSQVILTRDPMNRSLLDILAPHIHLVVPLALYFPTTQRINHLLSILPPERFSLWDAVQGVALFSDDVEVLDALLLQLVDQTGSLESEFKEGLMFLCLSYGRSKMITHLYQRFCSSQGPSEGCRLYLLECSAAAEQHGNKASFTAFVKAFGPTLVKFLPAPLQEIYHAACTNNVAALKELLLDTTAVGPTANLAAVLELLLLTIHDSTPSEVAALLHIFAAVEMGDLRRLKDILEIYQAHLEEGEWERVVLLRAVINGDDSIFAFLLEPNAFGTGYRLSNVHPSAFDHAIRTVAFAYDRHNIIDALLEWAHTNGLSGPEGMFQTFEASQTLPSSYETPSHEDILVS